MCEFEKKWHLFEAVESAVPEDPTRAYSCETLELEFEKIRSCQFLPLLEVLRLL